MKNACRILPVFILVLTACGRLFPQYPNYQVNTSSQYFFGEQSIKINPKNTNQIVLGVMGNFPSVTGISGCYYTTNGGLNWSGGPIYCSFAQAWGDPIIIVDTLGNFYCFSLANWTVSGPRLDRLLCFKSTNGGMNWSNGTSFATLSPKMDDMENACVDMSHGPYGNNIYVTFSLYDNYGSSNPLDSCYVSFCKSTDCGASFSVPIRISRIAGTAKADNTTPEGVCPCTGPGGEVYAVWPLNEKIMFNLSTNGGSNWLNNDIYVCDQVGGWLGRNWNTFGNWSPVMACDISNSPYIGTIYVCFADQRNGNNDRDVFIVKSTNKGTSWSAPKRVNNDGPGNDQRLPMICVDKVTGYVWIIFYDSRGYSSTVSAAYVARSTDGGNSFQNSRVSTDSWPNTLYIGEYMGIDACNNKVRPAWARPYGNQLAISFVGAVDTFYSIGINRLEEELPSSFTLRQNFPNPFNASSKIRFEIPKTSEVKLIVYDAAGREVDVLADELLQAGKYEVIFDGSFLSSGVYYYRITAGGLSVTKKMVLMK